MQLVLPPVELDNVHPSRNHYVHYLSNSIKIDGSVESVTKSFLIFKAGDTKICLTGNENEVDTSCQFIVLCKRAIKENHLSELKTHFRQWLKHPALKSNSTQEVIESWKDKFRFIEEDKDNDVRGLRNPQVGAIYSVLGHLKLGEEIGTVVLPTGTGKTETMLSILISARCKKLLVIVPTDPLRTQIARKFKTLGYLKEFDIVEQTAINPIVGIIDSKFKNVSTLEDFFSKCNVIVSTAKIFESTIDQQEKIAEVCSHIFVDEAHHSKAIGWEKIINKFDKGRIILFTATPFRNDGERLDGRIIFNFTLRRAQEQGYFKEIEFLPIREYDAAKSDQLIADRAVARLREDLSDGHDHILMARCNDKERARKVFQCYQQHEDLNPVMVFSGIPSKDQIIEDIRQCRHRIVVCVDMMGEGFDLAQLKVAAFHDIRKSLPITLQFAGRFTRTSFDTSLGNASFVANVYQKDVQDELEDLYAQDANWNILLPGISARVTQEQIDFRDFLSGFQNTNESMVPFQNIRPALSTVVYKNRTDTWNPKNFEAGIPSLSSYTHKFSSLNHAAKTLVILLGRQVPVDWGNFIQIGNLEWDIIVVYWNTAQNLLYVHGSDRSGHFQPMAKAVLGEGNSTIIADMEVFKVFHEVERLSLFNVGLRKVISKDLSFQSYIGRSVGEALDYIERGRGIKNNIFGVGFYEGEKTSLGCSKKGRIWSYARGNIKELTEWCTQLGGKLLDPNIDPDTVLRGTLRPSTVTTRPQVLPLFVDWDPLIYGADEDAFEFRTENATYTPATAELRLINTSESGPLQFEFHTDGLNIPFQMDLTEKVIGQESIAEHTIVKLSPTLVTVAIGRRQYSIEDFFQMYVPIFWFIDGSFLDGNRYVTTRQHLIPFPKENIIARNWANVNIGIEPQGVSPIATISIQYAIIQELCSLDFEIVYDDDGSGEIADVIAIKDNLASIDIHLFHLKAAEGANVSNDITNLYEVCGQAQKSVIWKHKDSKEFFDHLFRRREKKRGSHSINRLQKGTEEILDKFRRVARNEKPSKFYITIVQPSISKQSSSENILLLLAATSKFIKDVASVNLDVIGSP
ncbi:MAG TPA: DEAD/DEAH box helicase family protein [Cyclobacteriaceae bacterium]|nr:DEAD/DEAH box helicase family protein [Cyclobacteriaceae bacterium]